MSLADTRAAAAEAEAQSRALAARIVAAYTAAESDAAQTIAETVEIILTLAERRAALVRRDDIAGITATVPNAEAVHEISERFIAEHRLAAWVECQVDLGDLLRR